MAFNGSGVFNRIHSWATDKLNSVPITASRMDAEDDGFATGLSACITRDGQSTTTAKIPFASGVSTGDGDATTPAYNFTADTNTGIYRIGANNIGVSANGAKVLDISTTGLSVTGTLSATGAFAPATSDGAALGSVTLMWSDLFLASGGVINWNNGDVTATHSANALAFAGASSGYTFDAQITISSGNFTLTAGSITLTSGNITMTSGNFDLTSGVMTLPNTGLHLLDTNATHDLIIKPGSNLTADKTLTLTTGDNDRTLDISAASVTVSSFGASLVDDADAAAAQSTLGIGWVFLQKQTASASASITFTNISATYDNYMVVFDNIVPATDSVTFQCQTGTGGSVLSGASDYQYALTSVTTGGVVGGLGSAAASAAQMTGVVGNSTNEGLSGHLHLYAANGGRHKRFTWIASAQNPSTVLVFVSGGGITADTGVADRIRFLFSSGNIASGDFTIYGARKS